MNKFEYIYLDIEKKIKENIYPVGSLLPGEISLATEYNVSRETIRKAQRMLSDSGYIFKKQGHGSIVLDYRRFALPISGLVSYKELSEENNFSSTTQVIKNDIVSVPDFIMKDVKMSTKETFIHLIRTRSIDGEVVIIDEDYIRRSVVREIPNEFAEDSIYQYIEGELGLNIGFASKEFIGEPADALDIEFLKLKPEEYTITVRSQVFLKDATFFQYTISHHRIDRFRFQEFAPRHNRFINQ
ncbi:trehalose operon repressor [Aerococcaceae bacterium DSM 111021]|nr:trehalose operon repressor [Aerococcaceae bacterium DSM 111021]